MKESIVYVSEDKFIAFEPPHQQSPNNFYIWRRGRDGRREWLIPYRAGLELKLKWNWSPNHIIGLEPLNKCDKESKEALQDPLYGYERGVAKPTGEYAPVLFDRYIDAESLSFSLDNDGELTRRFKTTENPKDALLMGERDIGNFCDVRGIIKWFPVYRIHDFEEYNKLRDEPLPVPVAV